MIPAIVLVALVVVIIIIALGIALRQKYTPSTERADLTEYFGLTDSDSAAIVLNNEIIDEQARVIDGSIYVDYSFVHDTINPRFYWDENENILLYATGNELISADADSTKYYVTKSSVDYGRPIVKATSDSAYVDLDFVMQYSDFSYEYYTDPDRIVMTSEWGDRDVATVKKDTSVRTEESIKGDILADVAKEDVVTVLSASGEEGTEEGRNSSGGWATVMTADGVIGYVQSGKLSAVTTKAVESTYEPETFTHITKDFEICMAWHQVTNTDANSEVSSVLASTKGVNVISPTWFYLNDNEGGIANLASSDYVSYCHSQDVEVWALVSNLEDDSVDTSYVLTHTSTRQNLVNQIVSMAIQYDLDGINLDFEALNSDEIGDAYIEFVRELSIKCANNGIVLSVDNYVPTAYTAFYDRAEQANYADYVIIMGYDEHYAGSEEEGSVASLDWVKQGVIDTLAEVPASQVILGMPFYTRVWSLTPDPEAGDNTDADANILYTLGSQVYGMDSAQSLISENGAETQWIESAGQNYAEFSVDGVIYKVWLEDSDSAEARLKLLDEYSLAGASFWKLGFESSGVWDTIIKYIN
ncbi:MAG: glycosyl hydrolase family 18 protein [Clostridiales bacterium]|nr:glycosyl hydrolase family 18 protein [Clostridiales bacterium]